MRFRISTLLIAAILILHCESRKRNSRREQKGQLRVSDGSKIGSMDLRNEKLFSIFNIVTFKNGKCTTSSNLSGTCYTASECVSKGGSASGTCAAGFGVCCQFILSGCTVEVANNCTYVQNSEYPSTKTTAETCTITFSRICDDICQIRLDFVDFETTLSSTDGTCTDSFQVSSPFSTSTSAFPGSVCGTLTGQHMYFETGSATTGSAGTATLTTVGTTNTRKYRIKASYFTCTDANRAPANCAQYFTGVSGTVESYNFPGGQMIQARDDRFCFRQEEGYCSVQLTETAGATDAFDLAPHPGTTAILDCTPVNTWVSFPSTNAVTSNLVCGAVWSQVDAASVTSAVVGQSGIFDIIHYVKSGTSTANLAGFSLDFSQVPCN